MAIYIYMYEKLERTNRRIIKGIKVWKISAYNELLKVQSVLIRK